MQEGTRKTTVVEIMNENVLVQASTTGNRLDNGTLVVYTRHYNKDIDVTMYKPTDGIYLINMINVIGEENDKLIHMNKIIGQDTKTANLAITNLEKQMKGKSKHTLLADGT